jgi:hypothetical protein
VRTYHGRSRKLSLAHDKWLELNSKEFLLYPSVRILNGMSRQGQFIGLTQKSKRVVETIYSAGSISDCIIHRSGMGSRGNCTLEKTFIDKVVCFFLCNPFDPANLGRVLKSGYMFELQLLITTKLDKKKLDTETAFIQHKDSARVLLNGVNIIHDRIRTREQCKQTHTDELPEGINNVIDEIMEYEPEMWVPDINNHIFDADKNDDDDIGDDDEEMTINKSARVS